ncbi:MAG: hypothetical protein E6833_19005, partial [Bradyrhizobium sp.]|nr:hypothetical protein [Bradyrhizobium sp.]
TPPQRPSFATPASASLPRRLDYCRLRRTFVSRSHFTHFLAQILTQGDIALHERQTGYTVRPSL